MKLPKNWNEIKIATFQELQKFTEPSFENQIAVLSVLSGISVEQIEEMPISYIKKQAARLDWMADLPDAKNIKSFRIGFKRYRFALTPEQITAGQFITVQDLFNSGNWIDNLHMIMACMITKDGDFKKTAELFRTKMPISVAYAYTLFFSTCYPALLEVIQAYLRGVQIAAMMHKSEKEPD